MEKLLGRTLVSTDEINEDIDTILGETKMSDDTILTLGLFAFLLMWTWIITRFRK